jgi:predicted TIM-barrel fold metal-dependent hydrolase
MRYLMDKVPHAPLMGTDWPFIKTPPMPTHKEWFDAIRNLKVPDKVLESGLPINDFTQEEKDMILGENARSMLGIQ